MADLTIPVRPEIVEGQLRDTVVRQAHHERMNRC